MVILTNLPIDASAVLADVASYEAGAVVLFLGTTREFTQGRRTQSLDYECYPEMAEKKLAELEAEARRRWPLTGCSIVHRLGHMDIGETSVAVIVTSSHRRASFDACHYAIDKLKKTVPIWKKEFFEDGEVWVEGS